MALASRCGAALVTPHLTGQTASDKIAYEYETAHTFWEIVEPFARPAWLRDREVLDVGCGWGGKAIRYAELMQPRRIVGVDLPGVYDPSESESFAERLGVKTCQFSAARAEDLPFADEAFDVVFSDTALEHIEDPRRALQEMIRVLRPGGHVILRFPSIRMIGAHHLDRAINFPALHYLWSLETWAAGLNDRLLRHPRDRWFEPFDEVVRSPFGAVVTRNLNGLDLDTFDRLVADLPLDVLTREIRGVSPKSRTFRGALRRVAALLVGWSRRGRELLGTDIVFVAAKRRRATRS